MQQERSNCNLEKHHKFLHTFIYCMPPLYQFRIQHSFTDYSLTKE